MRPPVALLTLAWLASPTANAAGRDASPPGAGPQPADAYVEYLHFTADSQVLSYPANSAEGGLLRVEVEATDYHDDTISVFARPARGFGNCSHNRKPVTASAVLKNFAGSPHRGSIYFYTLTVSLGTYPSPDQGWIVQCGFPLELVEVTASGEKILKTANFSTQVSYF